MRHGSRWPTTYRLAHSIDRPCLRADLGRPTSALPAKPIPFLGRRPGRFRASIGGSCGRGGLTAASHPFPAFRCACKTTPCGHSVRAICPRSRGPAIPLLASVIPAQAGTSHRIVERLSGAVRCSPRMPSQAAKDASLRWHDGLVEGGCSPKPPGQFPAVHTFCPPTQVSSTFMLRSSPGVASSGSRSTRMKSARRPGARRPKRVSAKPAQAPPAV